MKSLVAIGNEKPALKCFLPSLVALAFSLGTACGESETENTYHWKSAVGGGYTDATKWEEGVVPPNDLENTDVVFPVGTSDMWITSFGKVHSILLSPITGNGKFTFSSHGVNEIGAGGVSMYVPSGKSAYIYGYASINLKESQTWYLDGDQGGSGLTIYSNVKAASNIVWNVSGKRAGINFTGGNGKDFHGQLKTNGSISYVGMANFGSTGTNLLTWSNGETPYAANTSLTMSMQIDGNKTVRFPSPICWDMGRTGTLTYYFYGRNTQPTYRDYQIVFDQPWTGDIGKVFKFAAYNPSASTRYLYNAMREGAVVFAQDGSGLTCDGNQSVWMEEGVHVVSNNNAFGVGNKIPFTWGDHWAGVRMPTGTPCALFASDGITIGSSFTADHDAVTAANGYLYNLQGKMLVLGLRTPGEAWYTGDINVIDTKFGKHDKNGTATYSTSPHVRLVAVKGAKVTYSGAFKGGKGLMPYTICGGGETVLSGDNTALELGLVVRSGTLTLGSDQSLGTKELSLGGTVPTTITVRAHTYTNVVDAASVIDGVTLAENDLVFLMGDLQGNKCGVYQYTNGTLKAVSGWSKSYGTRIRVMEGAEFAGTGIEITRGSNGGWSMFEEMSADPDVAVLATKGMTITNDICVTANLSAGTSTIGVGDASAVTYSGKITLKRDVTLYVAPGGSVAFTGAIVDAASTTNNLAVAGGGPIALPTGFDWTGRTLDLSDLDESALETSGARRFTLVGGISGAKVVLPTALKKWRVSVRGDKVVASKDGFTVIVR